MHARGGFVRRDRELTSLALPDHCARRYFSFGIRSFSQHLMLLFAMSPQFNRFAYLCMCRFLPQGHTPLLPDVNEISTRAINRSRYPPWAHFVRQIGKNRGTRLEEARRTHSDRGVRMHDESDRSALCIQWGDIHVRRCARTRAHGRERPAEHGNDGQFSVLRR